MILRSLYLEKNGSIYHMSNSPQSVSPSSDADRINRWTELKIVDFVSAARWLSSTNASYADAKAAGQEKGSFLPLILRSKEPVS